MQNHINLPLICMRDDDWYQCLRYQEKRTTKSSMSVLFPTVRPEGTGPKEVRSTIRTGNETGVCIIVHSGTGQQTAVLPAKCKDWIGQGQGTLIQLHMIMALPRVRSVYWCAQYPFTAAQNCHQAINAVIQLRRRHWVKPKIVSHHQASELVKNVQRAICDFIPQ